MSDIEARQTLLALAEDEERPRYCSNAGAHDLHRLNAKALRFALQAIEDRSVLADWSVPSLPQLDKQIRVARRHMRGEP